MGENRQNRHKQMRALKKEHHQKYILFKRYEANIAFYKENPDEFESEEQWVKKLEEEEKKYNEVKERLIHIETWFDKYKEAGVKNAFNMKIITDAFKAFKKPIADISQQGQKEVKSSV